MNQVVFTVLGEPTGKGRPRFSAYQNPNTGKTYGKAYTPKKINLKYVKEVQYGSDIESRLEQEGLITKHEITSNGYVNAQAITQWEKI